MLSQEKDLFPLRDSFFEDIHVKIPFEYAALLEEEYGKKALTLTTFEQYAHVCLSCLRGVLTMDPVISGTRHRNCGSL